MRHFQAHVFLDLVHGWDGELLIAFENALGSRGAKPDWNSAALPETDGFAALRRHYGQAKDDCIAMGLRASAASLDKLQTASTVGRMREVFEELYGRLRDEMAETQLLALSPEESEHYSSPCRKWEVVADRFPSTIYDIEESSKCLGLGRYTACVFHVMRVLESGLRALGKSLNPQLEPEKNPSWEKILGKCDDEMKKPLNKRTPEWQSDEPFFSTAAANLRAVKNAWRNPAMHVEGKYNEEEAREIYSAARGFMRHLATKLAE